nr:MAG TPA: hypothetical protein [Caudoviricetes sp.]
MDMNCNCESCVRQDSCDLYIESNGNPNRPGPCMCKTWYDKDGNLDNNTKRYLNHEELR